MTWRVLRDGLRVCNKIAYYNVDYGYNPHLEKAHHTRNSTDKDWYYLTQKKTDKNVMSIKNQFGFRIAKHQI